MQSALIDKKEVANSYEENQSEEESCEETEKVEHILEAVHLSQAEVDDTIMLKNFTADMAEPPRLTPERYLLGALVERCYRDLSDCDPHIVQSAINWFTDKTHEKNSTLYLSWQLCQDHLPLTKRQLEIINNRVIAAQANHANGTRLAPKRIRRTQSF